MRSCIFVLTAVLAVLVMGPAANAAISVADWGVTGGLNSDSLTTVPSLFNESLNATYLVNAREADVPGGHMYYRMEDRVGSGGSVGPNHGGQPFDVELIGAIISGSNLRIGIISGQRIPGSFSSAFEPGDIMITTADGRVYGIEVGAGGGLGSRGATYRINGDGYATGVRYSDGAKAGSSPYPTTFLSQQTAGSIWKTEAADWVHGIAPPAGGEPTQFQMQADSLDDLIGSAATYTY